MFGLILLYLAVMFAISGFIYLKANRDDISFYGHIFHWWISPLIAFAGLVFIDKGNKRNYFKRLSDNLLIKKS